MSSFLPLFHQGPNSQANGVDNADSNLDASMTGSTQVPRLDRYRGDGFKQDAVVGVANVSAHNCPRGTPSLGKGRATSNPWRR